MEPVVVALAHRHDTTVIVPAAFLPAVASFLIVLGTASGASSLAATVALFRAHARAQARRAQDLSRELARRAGEIPKELSRRLGGDALSPKAGGPVGLPVGRTLLGVGAGLLLVRLLLRLRRAFLSSLKRMNPCEDQLDPELKEALAAAQGEPWGEGLPIGPEPGEWRRYMHSGKDAVENIEEIHGNLGLISRGATEMTFDQITEGVRRLLVMKYGMLMVLTKRYWSRAQAETIAQSVAVAAGLKPVRDESSVQECCPFRAGSMLPFRMPKAIQLSQRWGIAALRPIFLDIWGWQSYTVETPFGSMHVYDTGDVPGSEDKPPLILQHGMFVTAWSMALLGWLLARRGRRVLLPDLFDFDHGLSASKLPDGRKVRAPDDSLTALTCVVREVLKDGAREVDLAGHSFGAWLTAQLAARCEREGLPVRKVVMLAPGGQFIFFNHNPMLSRLLNDPDATADAVRPKWMPAASFRAFIRSALGVMLSPNNCNLLVGLRFQQYLGAQADGTNKPTLLLWGDKDNVCTPRKPGKLVPFLWSRFPRLDGCWIDGGGHNIQIDSALAVARAMDWWLDPSARGQVVLGGRPVSDGRGGLAEFALLPTNSRLYAMDLTYARSTGGPVATEPARAHRSRM